eukprot:30923-Pelagococcus_subviridis.AAC.9
MPRDSDRRKETLPSEAPTVGRFAFGDGASDRTGRSSVLGARKTPASPARPPPRPPPRWPSRSRPSPRRANTESRAR